MTLTAKPLDEASLSALQQAGVYEEDKIYWFVYIVSQNAARHSAPGTKY